MKIIHVTTVPETLRFISGQVSYMQARGFEVHAVSSPGLALREFGEKERCRVHAIRMERRITPLLDLWATAVLIRRLRGLQPHIVHGHTPKGGLLAMLAAFVLSVPVRVFHLHGLPHSTANGFRKLLLRVSTKVSCLLAHEVISVSESVRAVAIDEKLCDRKKIRVLGQGSSNGIDAITKFCRSEHYLAERKIVRLRYNIPAEAFVVGFVGRLVRDKGAIDLQLALRKLEEAGHPIHLLAVGDFESHDPLPADTRTFYQCHPNAHITGWQSDVRLFYSAMDMLILPSYREGFPNVLLEAAALKLPAIATRVNGCVDAIIDGETGMLIPAGDPDAIALGIRSYLHDPELRTSLAENARRRVIHHFQPEPLWNELFRVYSRLLMEHRDSVLSQVRTAKTFTEKCIGSALGLGLIPLRGLVALTVMLLGRSMRKGSNTADLDELIGTENDPRRSDVSCVAAVLSPSTIAHTQAKPRYSTTAPFAQIEK